jgi:uncharacterized membrane protein YraQ (UPF0718 family)
LTLDMWMKTLPQPWTVAMEATIFTAWIYDHLQPHAAAVKVAHPLMLRAIAVAKKKNDRIDAKKIADCLRCDFLPECYMASTEIRERRRTLRYRNLLVRQAVQMKNKIAGLLMEAGVSYNKQKLHKVGYFRELLATNKDIDDVFGVLISAALRTSLSRTPLRRLFSGSSVRDQLAGALAGAPLMLCSCCVAPIFPAVYQRTRRLAPALALTLASPSLNPAALTLSFLLFPLRIAGARVAMALIMALLGPAVVAKITRDSASPATPEKDAPQNSTWRGLLTSYANSIVHVSVRTVPLILLGIWASMWIMRRLPPQLGAATGAHVLAVAMIALVATILTLPSLFEIPLALSMLAVGGPAGGAAALLFAGPAINLPSLIVIGRYSSWKVAASLALLV